MKYIKLMALSALTLFGYTRSALANSVNPPFQTVWSEDFNSAANGANSGADWGLVINQGSFQVNNSRLELVGVNAGSLATFTTNALDISAFENLAISLVVDDNDNNKETSDYVRAFYSLDGAARVQFGEVIDDVPSPETLSVSNLNGASLVIEIEIKVSYGNESYNVDDILVTGDPLSSGGGGSTSSLWSESGSDIYYDGGNVGIGLSDPSNPLQIVGNELIQGDNASLFIESNVLGDYQGGRIYLSSQHINSANQFHTAMLIMHREPRATESSRFSGETEIMSM
ncbi:hypothetical protein [Aureicoccus marinus]|uniref:Uncharacterized protein n=1 Tax=Aureicoccus marinus TaxID=754435 RepID=A0A2S7T5V5_9FLAO|nr:hypothetical protein [Aureicoccus marinus]PQJ15312.1 hypothetical protein BST99_05790 [Aureicoccus marinus]